MSLQLKRTHPPRNIPWEERPWPAQLAIWTASAAFLSLAWWQMFYLQEHARRSLFWIAAALILASSLSLSLVVARSSSDSLPRRRVLALCLSLLINTSLLVVLSRVKVFASMDVVKKVEQKKQLEEKQRQELEAEQLSQLIPATQSGSNEQVPAELQPLRTGDPALDERELVEHSSLAANERPEQETDQIPQMTPTLNPQLIERQQVTESAPRQFDAEGLQSAQRQQAEPRLGLPEALQLPDLPSSERPMPSLAESETQIERIGSPELQQNAQRSIPVDQPETPTRVAALLPERSPAERDAAPVVSDDGSSDADQVAIAPREAVRRPEPTRDDTAVQLSDDLPSTSNQTALTAPRPVETEPARVPHAESPSNLASATGTFESTPTPIQPAPPRRNRSTAETSPEQITANLRREAVRTAKDDPPVVPRALSVQTEEAAEPVASELEAAPYATATDLARAASSRNQSNSVSSQASQSAESVELDRPSLAQGTPSSALPRLRRSDERPSQTTSDASASPSNSRLDRRTERTAPSSLATPIEIADAPRPAAEEDQFQPEPQWTPDSGRDERWADAASADDRTGTSIASDMETAGAVVAADRSRVVGAAAVRRATDEGGNGGPTVNSVADDTSLSQGQGIPRAVTSRGSDSVVPSSVATARVPETSDTGEAAALTGVDSNLAASFDKTRWARPLPTGDASLALEPSTDEATGQESGNGQGREPSSREQDNSLSLSDGAATREAPLPRRQVANASAAEGLPQIASDSAATQGNAPIDRGRSSARPAPMLAVPRAATMVDNQGTPGSSSSSSVNDGAGTAPGLRPPSSSDVGRAAVVPPTLDTTPNPAAEGGLEVDLPTVEGVGGFGPQRSLDLGVLTRKSQVESTQVVDGLARFIRRDSGGQVSVTTHAPLPAQAYRHRMQRRGDSTDRSDDPGAARTERAIELGLNYLISLQDEDGSWSLQRAGETVSDNQGDAQPNLESKTAATGLALLSFLGAGYHHQSDRYSETVRRGIEWLVEHQKNDGDLYVPQDRLSNRSAWLYSHGIAAIALCEAYGMTQDPQLRKPAQKAVDFIVISQHRRLGGWRYEPTTGADTSVSGWMVMALRSAELANLDVPPETWERVGVWLDLAQESPEHPERYRYNPLAPDTPAQRHGRAPTKTITAVGLLMRLYLGWGRDQEEMKRGADVLAEHLPEMGTPRDPQRDTYYWYYATQVMFHMRGDHWANWNAKLHPLLTGTQEQTGPLAGSWNPRTPLPDRWAIQAGRLYVTTLNLLSLEVNYRHLPIYEDMQRETIRRDE